VTPHCEKLACYEMLLRALDFYKLVNMVMNLQSFIKGRGFLDQLSDY